ncbi:hypothetical protein NE237_012959 [Protea cynaroides]|uniref:Uncharacterized protein n=1 Tax=Protea cynaroides TaxID=273540 RepID=A0A9Q0JY41_9MAGN|nr:hypothetical protein NE237_012959 [Protea cynaroides]
MIFVAGEELFFKEGENLVRDLVDTKEGNVLVHFVLDLDESIEDHGTAFLKINLEVLQLGLGRILRIPSVDGEGLELGGILCLGLNQLGFSLRGMSSTSILWNSSITEIELQKQRMCNSSI